MSYRDAARNSDDSADEYRRQFGDSGENGGQRGSQRETDSSKGGSFSSFLAGIERELGVSFSGPDDPRREWLFQGKFLKVVSRNVYAIAYSLATRELFVQYLFWAPGMEQHSGPGPVYRYESISPSLALTAYDAASKGVWIWDNLRIRGTFAGHQFPYSLFHVANEYVPRKATFMLGGEWFVPRDFFAKSEGKWKPVRSSLPLAPVRWRGEDASPFTGKPDNGSPK